MSKEDERENFCTIYSNFDNNMRYLENEFILKIFLMFIQQTTIY